MRHTVILESFDGELVTVRRDDGKSHSVGEDCFCSVARYFGWKACSRCDNTDGSVDCQHRTAKNMLRSAQLWIESHIGAETDDPGWWD